MLNFNKFKNCFYLLFKDILSVFPFPIISRNYAIFVIFPCLLIGLSIFGGNERPMLFNSGSMEGEGIFKHFIGSSHSIHRKHFRVSEKIVLCDLRSKSSPKFSTGDSMPLKFGCAQGKEISYNYAKKSPNNTDCHDVISYLEGASLVLVLTWLWFCYKDYRDYGRWRWFPF